MFLVIYGLAFVVALAEAGDINRQSIVYHEETPDVFYCPQEKPVGSITQGSNPEAGNVKKQSKH